MHLRNGRWRLKPGTPIADGLRLHRNLLQCHAFARWSISNDFHTNHNVVVRMCYQFRNFVSPTVGIRKSCISHYHSSKADNKKSRDRGTPFSSWLAHVRPGCDVPMNAIIFSYVFAMLLSLINLGSAVALNIITSLGTGALLSSYIVSIR